MDSEMLRLECLRLATGNLVATGGGGKAEDIVKRAETYYKFLVGPLTNVSTTGDKALEE